MVPTLEFPPAIPLTLQVTLVLVVLVTVAANCCVAPRKTEAVGGKTLTLTVGGGGGGGAGFPPLVPQPIAAPAATIRHRKTIQPPAGFAAGCFATPGMPCAKARAVPTRNAPRQALFFHQADDRVRDKARRCAQLRAIFVNGFSRCYFIRLHRSGWLASGNVSVWNGSRDSRFKVAREQRSIGILRVGRAWLT